jgi:ABC-type sugar transport system ATPase subunit
MTASPLVQTPAVVESWLVARGVVKHYGGVKALRGADLELRHGQFHGLIGPNGAGKSTLVNILSGAATPDAGEITVDGSEMRLHDPADGIRHRVVLMPQKLAIIPAATVADNITLGREPSSRGLWSPRETRRRATAAMDVVGLDLDPRGQVSELSAVQKRLVMLARAIDQDPRLLILDEPTSGLPPNEAALVIAAVKGLMRSSLLSTVLFVSHDLSDVAEASDAVTCVREGVSVESLVGDDITKERLVELMLGAPAGARETVDVEEFAREAPAEAQQSIAVDNVHGVLLKGVSARFSANSVTGVAGLLGSGDDELLSVLVGATTPSSGAVVIDGRVRKLKSPADALKLGICYLGGERTSTTFPALPIRDNVSVSALSKWFGRWGFMRTARERELVTGPLAALSVEADPDRHLATLSGGNQQRALVARLIAADTSVVVIKEPTVGVDVRARRQLWDAVRALSSGRTVIVASGEPEELVALCDRVLCIRRGRLVAELEGSQLSEHAITAAIS